MNRAILTANGQAIIVNHVFDPEIPTTMTFKIPGVRATVFTLELVPEKGKHEKSDEAPVKVAAE